MHFFDPVKSANEPAAQGVHLCGWLDRQRSIRHRKGDTCSLGARRLGILRLRKYASVSFGNSGPQDKFRSDRCDYKIRFHSGSLFLELRPQ